MDSSSAPTGNWGSRDCRSGTGLLSCAGARGDIGAGSRTAGCALSFASVARLGSALSCGGTGSCGCGHWSALLVGRWLLWTDRGRSWSVGSQKAAVAQCDSPRSVHLDTILVMAR